MDQKQILLGRLNRSPTPSTAGKLPKEGIATLCDKTAQKIMQFSQIYVGGQYVGSIMSFKSTFQDYIEAHTS